MADLKRHLTSYDFITKKKYVILYSRDIFWTWNNLQCYYRKKPRDGAPSSTPSFVPLWKINPNCYVDNWKSLFEGISVIIPLLFTSKTIRLFDPNSYGVIVNSTLGLINYNSKEISNS